MDFACHSRDCRPPTSGGTGGSVPGGSQGAAYMAMKRRDAVQQQTIAVNKYRAGVGMSQLPVTAEDRAVKAKPSIPAPTAFRSGRQIKQISNVGKVKARLMPDSLLARLYPSTTGEARRSIKAEMSRRGLRYQDILDRTKIA